MTTPILDRTQYDNRVNRWRDNASGRYIPAEAVTGEMRRLQDATFATLDGLTQRLYSGQISLSQWQVAAASELKDAHLAQAMFGAGGRRNMGNAEWGRVGQTLREQYAFLNNFASEIAAGKVSQAQALARIRMYGRATQQSYWAEWTQRSTGVIHWRLAPAEHCQGCLANAGGSPYTRETLPNYPGDGSTQCRANCLCYLERD